MVIKRELGMVIETHTPGLVLTPHGLRRKLVYRELGLKVFADMKFFTRKSRLFLALAFAITVYPLHDNDFLHPAGLSKVIAVHGEQEESTGTPSGDAEVDYVAHINLDRA